MSNKKKIIIICTMVVLLVAAAYLNVLLNNRTDDDTVGSIKDGDTATVSFFSKYRTVRDTTRAETFSYYDAIISSEASSANAVASAEANRLALVETAETELVLEGLIKAKGFEDAVVTISTNNVNVIVMDPDLDAADTAQILSIITAETSAKATNVIITPYSI